MSSQVVPKRDIIQSVQQLQDSLCGECEQDVAIIDCEDCHESYCKPCCETVHRKGRRKQHTNFVKIQICGQCEVVAAKLECLECQEYYCCDCSKDVHSRGQRTKHKYIRNIDTSRFRAVNYDNNNAFGLVVKQLSFSRFQKNGSPPRHMAAVQQASNAWAAECRDEDKPFVDTEPATLEVLELPRPQQISSQIQSAEVMEELEAELKRMELERQRKHEALREIFDKVYTWRRPRQFAAFPSLFGSGNQLLAARPQGCPLSPGYITYLPMFKESAFNDTFFLLAVISVVRSRALVANLFVSCEHADVGLYTFQFYQDDTMGAEGWKCISIDHLTPCGSNLTPLFGATEDANEIWGVLLQKAYAKFLGAYGHLHYGDAARALCHLTGGKPLVEGWVSGRLDEQGLEHLWWKLSEASRLGLPVICMRRPEKAPLLSDVFKPFEDRNLETNLVPDDGRFHRITEQLNWDNGECLVLTYHASGVRDKVGHKLVKLQNVHGTTWTGEWSDSSTMWTKEMRELTNHKQLDDHISWMSIRDFASEFDTVCYLTSCRPVPMSGESNPIPETFFDTVQPESQFGLLPCNAHQYLITVASPMPPKDDRTDEAGVDENGAEVVYKPPDWRVAREDEEEAADQQGVEERAERGVLTLNIHTSQPELPVRKSDGFVTPVPKPVDYDVLLFRLQDRQIQRPVQAEADGDGEDEESGKKYIGEAGQPHQFVSGTAWQFPTHNQLQKKPVGKFAPSSYHKDYQISVQAGYYILVLQLNQTGECMHYSLSVTVCDEGPSDLAVEVEPAGTAREPTLAPLPDSHQPQVVSPRLMIQAAKGLAPVDM